MNRNKQFSIRWLLLLILVAALLAAIVRSLLIVDVVESHISVAVFGKTKYDRPAAHLDFIKSLNQRFSAIDRPIGQKANRLVENSIGSQPAQTGSLSMTIRHVTSTLPAPVTAWQSTFGFIGKFFVIGLAMTKHQMRKPNLRSLSQMKFTIGGSNGVLTTSHDEPTFPKSTSAALLIQRASAYFCRLATPDAPDKTPNNEIALSVLSLFRLDSIAKACDF